MTIDFSQYYWKNELIQLRQPKEDDWQLMCQSFYRSEKRFMFDCIIELPLDVEGFKNRYIKSIENNRDGLRFAILDKNEKHVGIANVFGIDERHGCFGPIGIQINDCDRRKGYALSTLIMLGNYMFRERRMHKWESSCTKGNTESEYLHKKMGFAHEGTRRQNVFHNGQYWDELLFGMTDDEFIARHANHYNG